MLIKALVKDTLDKFPNTFSIEGLVEQLIFLYNIARANAPSENGETISEDQLKEEEEMVQIKWTQLPSQISKASMTLFPRLIVLRLNPGNQTKIKNGNSQIQSIFRQNCT